MEDSQSSASNNRVTTPPPLTPCRRPPPVKRRHYGPNKRDASEEILLKIIEKKTPEKQPDENEIFCLSLATSLRKIQDPQRKEYIKLQLQQTMYNCMYGSQPNVGLTQPQPQQVPMPMSHHQQNYNYSVNSDGSTLLPFKTWKFMYTVNKVYKYNG